MNGWTWVALIVWVCHIGCSRQNTGSEQDEALRSVVALYPALIPQGVDAAQYFHMTRKFWSENSNIEMELYVAPDSIDSVDFIVLFNKAGMVRLIGLALLK